MAFANTPYLTGKQVKAMKRAIKRAGEGPIKVGTCRRVSKRDVSICHDRQGFYVGESPHKTSRRHKISRARRLHPGY